MSTNDDKSEVDDKREDDQEAESEEIEFLGPREIRKLQAELKQKGAVSLEDIYSSNKLAKYQEKMAKKNAGNKTAQPEEVTKKDAAGSSKDPKGKAKAKPERKSRKTPKPEETNNEDDKAGVLSIYLQSKLVGQLRKYTYAPSSQLHSNPIQSTLSGIM